MNRRFFASSVGLAMLLVLGGACNEAEPDHSQHEQLEQPPEPVAKKAEPTTEEPAEPAAPTSCTYDYDADQTKLTWTAFKLTERVGVGGTFDAIEVSGTEPADDAAQVFKGMRFKIDTSTVNTGNPERDAKIAGAFFGKLARGKEIQGQVTEIQEGKGVIELTLGGVTKPVPMEYTVSPEGQLVAVGKIDVMDYRGGRGLKTLNRVCKEQHTGPDKKSKLWPDVELKVESQLKKECS